MVPIGLRALVACRPFRNRTVGNSVVVVVVVGVVRVIVQRPDGVRRDPLLELELFHFSSPSFSSYSLLGLVAGTSFGLLRPGAYAGLPDGNCPGGKSALDGAIRCSSSSMWSFMRPPLM